MAKYLIIGDTFDYRQQIRSLGGEWRKKYKGWDVPNSEAIAEFMREHTEFEMLVIETIEQLRERAQEVADEKANRLIERAAKRRQKAKEMEAPIERMRGDTAFFTQPNINSSSGRAFTRQRERMFDKYRKGIELEAEADELEARAESIRFVQIQGDAERRREKQRREAFERLPIGTKVNYFHNRDRVYTVVKHNKKTVRIQRDSEKPFSVDPLYLQVIE